MKLLKKTAIITGCARGIGQATARLFCKEGASLVINDLTDEIFTLEKELLDAGCNVVAVKGSIADYETVEKIVNTALEILVRSIF